MGDHQDVAVEEVVEDLEEAEVVGVAVVEEGK